MADLSFDLTVNHDDFALQAAASVPLTGITALSGPSGSGKTTLLRAIAGLEPLATGNVHMAGQEMTGLPAEQRGVGYVFQDARLFPHLDVAGNLAYGAKRRGTAPDQIRAVVEALDLGPLLHRAPENLSGGETRRVALGRALASGPRILLMDEPLAGLDRARKLQLMPYIARVVAGFGVPALYVTHSAVEISFLADRTLNIADGRLTGWSSAAPRVLGQVIATAPGQVQITFGEQQLWLPGEGNEGEIWAIPLAQDCLISDQPPGLGNAALSLQGRVLQAEPGAGTIGIDIAGQAISFPWQRIDGRVPDLHASVWLSLPRLLARPVQTEDWADDSMENQ